MPEREREGRKCLLQDEKPPWLPIKRTPTKSKRQRKEATLEEGNEKM